MTRKPADWDMQLIAKWREIGTLPSPSVLAKALENGHRLPRHLRRWRRDSGRARPIGDHWAAIGRRGRLGAYPERAESASISGGGRPMMLATPTSS